MQTAWFRALLSLCGVLLVVAVCIEVYRWAERHSTRLVEAHPLQAWLEIKNPPAWLDGQIVTNLRDEAIAYASRDDATYDRAENVLDNGILREIAGLYTGEEIVDGKSVNHQAQGFNAWIQRVTEVRRNVAKDHQIIEIYAAWRTPAAWVRSGDLLYLVDAQGVRLPGDYPLTDRTGSGLMVITGVDLPKKEGIEAVPLPGETWSGNEGGQMGEDLAAGMKLVEVLRGQKFQDQIDAVDMTNFQGRKDRMTSWIVLLTIWPASDGKGPSTVLWGRPVGQEKYYDVQAAAKVKVLNELYMRFNRIDAHRDYVDIHGDYLMLPKVASQAEESVPAARG